MSQQTYANGAVYEPMYDSRDRFAGEMWDSVQTSAYAYNDKNQLSRMVDNITHTAYQYVYCKGWMSNPLLLQRQVGSSVAKVKRHKPRGGDNK